MVFCAAPALDHHCHREPAPLRHHRRGGPGGVLPVAVRPAVHPQDAAWFYAHCSGRDSAAGDDLNVSNLSSQVRPPARVLDIIEKADADLLLLQESRRN